MIERPNLTKWQIAFLVIYGLGMIAAIFVLQTPQNRVFGFGVAVFATALLVAVAVSTLIGKREVWRKLNAISTICSGAAVLLMLWQQTFAHRSYGQFFIFILGLYIIAIITSFVSLSLQQKWRLQHSDAQQLAKVRRQNRITLVFIPIALIFVAFLILNDGFGLFHSQASYISSVDTQSLFMISSNDGWAAGIGFGDATQLPASQRPITTLTPAPNCVGAMLHYNGSDWSPVGIPTCDFINSLSMVSSNEGWAVGDNGTILHYKDGAWQPTSHIDGMLEVSSLSLYDVKMTSANSGWAVGDGVILQYSYGRWSISTNLTNSRIYKLSMINAEEGWALAQNNNSPNTTSYFLHLKEGKWSVVDPGLSLNLRDISMLSVTDGWAVSFDGTILHYTNSTWSKAYTPTSPAGTNLHGFHIKMISPTDGWVAGDREPISNTHHLGDEQMTLLHYDGDSWTPFDVPYHALPTALYAISSDDVWVAGVGGHIFHYHSGNWKDEYISDNLNY